LDADHPSNGVLFPRRNTVKGDEACALVKDAIEARPHFTASTPRRREPVGLQVGIEPPDQPADMLLGDMLLGDTLLVSERLQLVHQTLGVNPACDRRSPGKENGDDLKPFVALQRVRHRPGKGAARQPEASLAWVAVTPLVKRRQQIPKPGVEPVLDPGAASAEPLLARSC
jgi:hypothetical protein